MIGSMILTFTVLFVGIGLLTFAIFGLVSMWKDEEYLLFSLGTFTLVFVILLVTGYTLYFMDI